MGTALVSGLGKLDQALESAKVLPKLEPAYVPPEVQDEDGGLSEECLEVRPCGASRHVYDCVTPVIRHRVLDGLGRSLSELVCTSVDCVLHK